MPQTCQQACEIVRIIQGIRIQGDAAVVAAISEPPKVDVEGLEKLAERFPTVGDANAKPLSVQGPSGDAVVPTSPSAKVTADQAPPPAPPPAHRKLSKKEIRQLTAALPQKYRDFLQLVDIIITDDEREVFLQISENYQRDKFIDAFWKRRSIDSQGIRTDYRAVYTQRVQLALEQFGNLNNDRAKIFVINGPPDAVIPIDCQDSLRPAADLVLRAARGPEEQGLPHLLRALRHGRLQAVAAARRPRRPARRRGLADDGRAPAGRRPRAASSGARVEQAIAYTTAVLGSGRVGDGRRARSSSSRPRSRPRASTRSSR